MWKADSGLLELEADRLGDFYSLIGSGVRFGAPTPTGSRLQYRPAPPAVKCCPPTHLDEYRWRKPTPARPQINETKIRAGINSSATVPASQKFTGWPMAEPQRNVDVSTGVCDVCPECHSHETIVTIKSDTGVYCRCSDCGHIWHQDEDDATH